MGRHEDYIDPEAFAEEILGTQAQQTDRWFDREIRWRQRLVEQYNNEIAALENKRGRAQSVIAAEVEPQGEPETGVEATQAIDTREASDD